MNCKGRIKKILISRTDNMGDVILTLPIAGAIKKSCPTTEVAFLGKAYTQPIIEQCQFIDTFYNWTRLKEQNKGLEAIGADAILHLFPEPSIAMAAKRARIPIRIGTSHRVYHWYTCNRLVPLGRKKSDLHEAQLNLKLLAPLEIPTDLALTQIPVHYGWSQQGDAPVQAKAAIEKNKLNVIFHMKSKKSAKEWPSLNYQKLAEQLPWKAYNILITGTNDEGACIKTEVPALLDLPHVKDMTGQLDVKGLLALINDADGLVACSTGPLHIAAATGIHTLGLFPKHRPMHATRWGPVGKKAHCIVDNITPPKEKFLSHITVEQVKQQLLAWKKISKGV